MKYNNYLPKLYICFGSSYLRFFRQNAAREDRSYAPGWGSRCARCRYRHLAHRNHRHKAQEGAPCAPVWRRATTEDGGRADGVRRWDNGVRRWDNGVAEAEGQDGELRTHSRRPQPEIRRASPPPLHALSGTSRCSARQFWLAEHRIRPYRGLRDTLTCSANFGLGLGSYSRHPHAGPHPFSTPAPNTPDTCAKNRHYLSQPPCFPVIRVFRQNAAREGRLYAPGWGLRCANCRYRPVAHRNHRHKAQEGAP